MTQNIETMRGLVVQLMAADVAYYKHDDSIKAFLPCRASVAPKLTLVMVLPVPPFLLLIAKTLPTSVLPFRAKILALMTHRHISD